jgi:hypothetical protein
MSFEHLTDDQVRAQLSAGRPVEQWLGHKDEDSYRLLRWLRVDPERDGTYSVALFEVFDEGSEEFLDVYGFSPVDPDLLDGEISSWTTKEEALEHALSCGASRESFVAAGGIQDVYADFLSRMGPPPE